MALSKLLFVVRWSWIKVRDSVRVHNNHPEADHNRHNLQMSFSSTVNRDMKAKPETKVGEGESIDMFIHFLDFVMNIIRTNILGHKSTNDDIIASRISGDNGV